MHIARSRQFVKQYQKAPRKTQAQFDERLRLYLLEPSHPMLHVHLLTGEYAGLSSFNVTGDIRALFEIQDGDTIYFVAIGSHSELYG